MPTPQDAIHRTMTWPLLYALPRGLLEATHAPNPYTDYDPARAREIFRRIRAAASETNARFLIVDIPEQPDREQEEGRSYFDDYCQRAGAECVETTPLFELPASDPKKLPGPYLLQNNIHYSRQGYAVVAEAVPAYLAAHPAAPPPESGTTHTTHTTQPSVR